MMSKGLTRSTCSLDLSQEISDLFLRALMEGAVWVSVLNDSYFQVPLSHFSLKGVLECLDSCMNSITNIHVIRIGLLQETASLSRSLA